MKLCTRSVILVPTSATETRGWEASGTYENGLNGKPLNIEAAARGDFRSAFAMRLLSISAARCRSTAHPNVPLYYAIQSFNGGAACLLLKLLCCPNVSARASFICRAVRIASRWPSAEDSPMRV